MRLILSLAAVLALSSVAEARPRGSPFVGPVAQNDGNMVSLLSVTCTTHTWTSVAAANPRRRKLELQVSNFDSNAGVCLSSGTVNAAGAVAGDACVAARPGYEIYPSTPTVPLILRDEDPWLCRVRGGTDNKGVIKGAEFYDDRDETAE